MEKRISKKHDLAKTSVRRGRLVMEKTKKLDKLVNQVPGMKMAENGVYLDDQNLSGVLSYQKCNITISNIVSYKPEADSHGLHQFKCLCQPRNDLHCVHIFVFAQRLSSGPNSVGYVPSEVKILHLHLCIERLTQKCKYLKEPIYYSELEEIDMLTGSVSTRPGRPSQRSLKKITSAGYIFGYCGEPKHNKLTSPRLNTHCSSCGLKGHNYLTCRTPLEDYFRSTKIPEELFDIH